MIRLFVTGGPYMVLLLVLAVVVLVLSAKKVFDLFFRSDRDPENMARGLDAILFWGCISAVLGFLGQFTAGYISLMIIRSAEIVNPALVAEGIAVSLISTVFGLFILIGSALIWFGLRCRLNGITGGQRR
jgi:biopolymer transport protein ExbB/TolQ